MTSDQILIDALNEVLPVVSAYEPRSRDSAFYPMHLSIPPEVYDKIAKLTIGHVLFRRRGNLYFGGKSLHYSHDEAARLLINKAMRVGPEASVGWLNRVHMTEVADVRYVAEVFGLRVRHPYQVCNGVRFCNFKDVPDSKMSAPYKHRHQQPQSFFDVDRPSAAILEVSKVPMKKSSPGSARSEAIDLAVLAHVVANEEAAPFVGYSWVEFVDVELEDADIPIAGAALSKYDGPIPVRSPHWVMNPEAVPTINALLELPEECRETIEIAASRLITARNRSSPTNKAIDGCICLEALLSDKQPGELTYKLALRAALLIGRNVPDRRTVRDQVKEFYGLRSRAVHGAHKSRPTDRQIAQDGMNVCTRVLDKIVELNAIPKWAELEIGT